MTFGSLVIFLFVLYLFFIVGRSIWINYQSNKDLDVQNVQVLKLEDELKFMQYQINYYKTSSFKEKEAREKLGYQTPGEKVVALPVDKLEDKVTDPQLGEVEIKTANYINWWRYFTE